MSQPTVGAPGANANDPDWAQAVQAAKAFGGDPNDYYQQIKAQKGGKQAEANVFLGDYTYGGGRGGAFYSGGRADSDATRPDRGGTSNPQRVTVDQSDEWFMQHYDANDATFKRIKQTMLDAGLIKGDDDVTKMLGVWHDFSNIANISGRTGGTHTPDWYMRRVAEQQSTGKETWTETDTSRTVHNPKDLQAAFQGVAADALGRRATPGEAASAASIVGAKANADPTITTSTQTSDPNASGSGGVRTQSSVTRQGMGVDAINEELLQQAMQNPEYGAYQAAGHYFPLLVNALSAINQAGT